MNIDSIELFHVGLPLRQPLQTPLGPREKLETVIVAMHGGGAVGWGEASPGNAPLAGAEWAAGAFSVLRDWLAPAVVGQGFSSGDELAKRLELFRGNQFAKAALDMAWWDLSARLQNRPLHELLVGGKNVAQPPSAVQEPSVQPRAALPQVEVGPTFDRMASIDEFAAQLAAAVEAGFTRVKLKFRPGWDVQMVDFVRKEFPTLSIHIDCEGGLTLGHTEMLYRLEDFMLAMIEQPLAADDLVGHAMLQESLRTPICLDESIASLLPGRHGDGVGELQVREPQAGQGRRTDRGRGHPRSVPRALHALLRRRDAAERHRRADRFRPGHERKLHLSGRFLPFRPNSRRGHGRAAPADERPGRRPAAGAVEFSRGIGVEPQRALLEKFCIAQAKIVPV